jgi:spore maturation protein CgeB
VRWLACAPGPAFSVKDVHDGYVEALRAAGEQVVDYPLGDALTFYDSVLLQAGSHSFRKALSGQQATELAAGRLAGALYRVRPDVLLITSGFFVDTDLLAFARRDGVRVVAILTEQPYEHTRELELARHCDLVLLTDPINIGDFQQATRAAHAPHCHRSGVHVPGPPDPALACDFAFVGTGYQSRIEFFERMDLAGLDVLLAGNWQQLGDDSPLHRMVATGPADCLDNAATAEIYRSAAVGINLYRREAEDGAVQGWAVGPREIEMAAIGAFFLRDPRPEGDELFPMLPTFTSPEQASDQLRWWLARPDLREAAVLKAREAVADRTFDNAAARLLRLLDKE